MRKLSYISYSYLIKILNRYAKTILLILLVVNLIVFWQLYIVSKSDVSDEFSRKDGSGLILAQAAPFTYFHYYLNYYPIRTNYENPEYSVEGAKSVIKEHPDKIFNDNSYYITWGEHGKEWLLLASSYLKHTPKNLSIVPINSIIFIFSLVLLAISFILIKKPVLGLILVLILGSNPFSVYEVYKKENVFNIGISVLLILLSINLPLIFNKTRKKLYIILATILSGIILGLLSHVRMEYITISLSCLMVYLTMKANLKLKILVVSGFLFTITTTSILLGKYFDYKISQAISMVTKFNDTKDITETDRRNYHTIWHPILIGLGDFDTKYGYKWDDQMAYSLARPILKEKYPDKYQKMEPGELMSVFPEYHQIIKSEVLNRIKSDPKWYVNIIYNRIIKLLTNGTPVTINLGNQIISFSFTPIFGLLTILVIALLKKWEYLKIVLFSTPISISIIAIHSLYGITNLTLFHQVAFVVFIYIIIEILIKKRAFKFLNKILLLNYKNVN